MELVALRYSPWSEKARWALDHHGVAYTYTEYTPMLGELPLRLRARKMRGKITVPILFDEDRILGDSFAIAQRAEAAGKGAALFSPGDATIGAWNEKSEALLRAGRGIVLRNMAADRQAQRDSLPKIIPQPLRGASVSVAAVAMRFLQDKHGTRDADVDATTRAIDEGLAELRASLKDGDYLEGGAFSYADIAMAVTLQMVSPVADEHIRLGEARRRCWTIPSLAAKYADLVAWRDALYAKHRGKRISGRIAAS